jgi:hypothetical protein
MTSLTRSSARRTFPPKASSVHSSMTEPGTTRWMGSTPPNVQANCSGRGVKATTSTGPA